jgi:hypothetical protein
MRYWPAGGQYGHFMTFIHAPWRLSILRASPMAGQLLCIEFYVSPGQLRDICVCCPGCGCWFRLWDDWRPTPAVRYRLVSRAEVSSLPVPPIYSPSLRGLITSHTHTHHLFCVYPFSGRCLYFCFLFFLLHDSWRDRIFFFFFPSTIFYPHNYQVSIFFSN